MEYQYTRTDCFGYDADKKECKVLSETICKCNRRCAFYKSEKQYKIGRNKSYLKERLFRDKLEGEND